MLPELKDSNLVFLLSILFSDQKCLISQTTKFTKNKKNEYDFFLVKTTLETARQFFFFSSVTNSVRFDQR